MNASPEILRIAQRRVDALMPDSLYGDTSAARARLEQLAYDLVNRGTSAVAEAEGRLLAEALDAMDAEMEAEQRAEVDAENAWLRVAEAPTLDDLAFEDYEARRGLI